MPSAPDPYTELTVAALATLRGANYWSARPVTRLDLHVGAYDDVSSAEVAGVTDRLMTAMPGLREHRCSVGKPGGFELRLRRGTYAPHIIEHVALELQAMIGHEVGYGRARGGDRVGEYTVVFEHRHGGVGRCGAALALDIVRAAFAARPIDIQASLAALQRTAGEPDPAPRVEQHVACGIIGGGEVGVVRGELARHLNGGDADVTELAPEEILREGLPYRSAGAALILDLCPSDGLPARYRDPASIRRLYSVVADAVPDGGWLIIPAGNAELAAVAERVQLRTAIFGGDGRRRSASLRSCLVGDMLRVEENGRCLAERPASHGVGPREQLAAILTAWILEHA